MKNRIELAKHFNELGFKKGVEVGVAQGIYSRILLDNIPGLDLLGVDSYEGKWAPLYDEAVKNHPNLIKGKSIDVASSIADESLDFVFIDADHTYESVKEDIEAWTPKVRKGGIVSGHDYYMTRQGNFGVIQAVNDYVDQHGYKLQTTLWDLHAYKDDKQPSWYFRKDK